MKKLLVLTLALSTGIITFAQQPKAKPVAKPAAKSAAKPALKSALDSCSYALGLSLAQFYKQQGIKNVNTSLVTLAINDGLKGGKALLTEEEMNASITNYLQTVKAEKSAVNKKAGQTFLASNKNKAG